MIRWPKLTEEQQDEIKRLYRSDVKPFETYDSLGRKYGVSQWVIMRVITNAYSDKPRWQLVPGQRESIRSMINQGVNTYQIARTVGVSDATIRNERKRMNANAG